MEFNASPSYIMHIDVNSCFATIEQQANPKLRGNPVVVAAYTTNKGAILAASKEAKRLGIKTGMRVMDGHVLYPRLIVLPPDPNKYRYIHLKLRNLISDYTADFAPKSIDEFVLNMTDYPKLVGSSMQMVAKEIKQRIKTEIGDWITVSIGIAPNRYLAKVAAGIKKPDGLEEINHKNFKGVYKNLGLKSLTGIKDGNTRRLNSVGIYSVLDFYSSPIWKLKAAFHSITSLYWQTRLHGYEIDNVETKRGSYGNSTAIGENLTTISQLTPILARLTEKTAARARLAGYSARGVHLAISYKDWSYWHMGHSVEQDLNDTRDIFRLALSLLTKASPDRAVRELAVSVFNLTKTQSLQLDFFNDVSKNKKLTLATDEVNQKWGDFTLHLGRSFAGASKVKDRIAFGGVKELEELQRPRL